MFLWNIAVTSLAEVWIEIDQIFSPDLLHIVTSLAEVWIEISAPSLPEIDLHSHFPCGSVD